MQSSHGNDIGINRMHRCRHRIHVQQHNSGHLQQVLDTLHARKVDFSNEIHARQDDHFLVITLNNVNNVILSSCQK